MVIEFEDNEPEETNEEEQEIENESEESSSDEEKEEWKPDYKFKSLDKEYEFDDYIKPIVNKDNYEQIKNLYEKAYGLDHVKTKYQKTQEELEHLKPTYEQQSSALGYMGSLIQKKDYNTLFKELKIPDEDLMKIALEKANYQEFSPEQKAVYDKTLEERQRNYLLEMQNQQYQKMFQENVVKERYTELERALSQDHVKDVVSDFDTRAGKPGAFKEEVIRRGQMYYYTQGKDISVNDAVNEVVNLYSSGRPAPSTQQNNTITISNTKKPYIPNIKSGSNASPVGKIPTSIADLRKLSENYKD